MRGVVKGEGVWHGKGCSSKDEGCGIGLASSGVTNCTSEPSSHTPLCAQSHVSAHSTGRPVAASRATPSVSPLARAEPSVSRRKTVKTIEVMQRQMVSGSEKGAVRQPARPRGAIPLTPFVERKQSVHCAISGSGMMKEEGTVEGSEEQRGTRARGMCREKHIV